jgi:hypothetical protein
MHNAYRIDQKHWHRLAAGLLLSVLLATPYHSLAQENFVPPADLFLGEEGTTTDTGVPSLPANAVSCFDYYTFGSVQADLSPSTVSTVSGTSLAFKGALKNDNPYPIVDGALYVKVFRSRGATNDGNGPDVVDQFLVKGGITIPAKSSVPMAFTWRVPAYAQSGDYQLATFFTTSRKFNLLGLSFTDDVVGNTVPFTISGEQTGAVRFDKSSVTVNDDEYYFAAFPPRVGAADPAIVEAKVRNTTNVAQAATISWTVYQWDAQLRENAVQEETRQVNVPAGGTADVSITVRDAKYPVYLVVGTLKWMDSQSIIGARFVREGVNRTRINFPGVTAFPLRAGVENTLFSCLHNSGEATVPNGRLELTLTDSTGNIIDEYTYSGDVTSAMMGVAQKFVPQQDYDFFVLDARLYQGEEFIDEAHLVYDCKEIDPSMCNPVKPIAAGSILGTTQSMAVIALGIIVLIAALWIYRRLGRKPNTTPLPPM